MAHCARIRDVRSAVKTFRPNTHTRWHANRGVREPTCSLCAADRSPTSPDDVWTWQRDVDAWIKAGRRVIAPQTDGLGSQTTVLTHLDHARERRTPDERAALLDAALADLRAGTRRRVPSGGPLPF